MRRILILVLTSLLCPAGWCGIPVTRTATITGQVTDSESGMPIQNAIVAVQWYASPLISMGPGAYDVGKFSLAITDATGHYKISPRLLFTPFGWKGLELWVWHPLYHGKEETAIYHGDDFLRKHRRAKSVVYEAGLEKRSDALVGHDVRGKTNYFTSIRVGETVVRAYRDDYSYLRALRELGIDPGDVVPNWSAYRERAGTKAILTELGVQ